MLNWRKNNRNRRSMEQKPSTISPWLGGAAILVALYTVLFSGMRSFSQEDAERMLSRFSTHLSETAGMHGRESKLQYSAIEIEGFAYDRWAQISQISLDFLMPGWQGKSRLSLSTERADLVPDHASPSRLMLRLPEHINVISGSDLLAILQPVVPISYSVNLRQKGDIRHHLTIPGNVGVTMLEPRREMLLRLSAPLVADVTLYDAQDHVATQLTSGAVQALFDDGAWRTGGASLRYDSVQKGPSVSQSSGTLTIDDVQYTHGNNSSIPLTITAAWSLKQQRSISGDTDDSELTIDRSLVTTGDAKISATGSVHFDLDDSPYGEISLEIYNPVSLIKSGWIRPGMEPEALSLLSEIAGDDVTSYTHTTITIERPKNGAWRVGKMPLDALLAKGFAALFTFNAQEEQKNEQDNGKKTNGAEPS